MHALEAEVPAEAWEAIRESIAPEPEKQPAPVRRMPVWQYAAAAVVILGTALGIYYISPGKNSPVGAEQLATSLIPKDSPLAGTSATPAPAVPVATAAVTTPDPAKADPGHPHTFKEYHSPGITVSYTDGNYIRLRATDGRDHRVSYKCAVLIPCLANGAKAEDKVPCAEDLNNWKKKLGESGFIPAPDNFFDIAGMASMLESAK